VLRHVGVPPVANFYDVELIWRSGQTGKARAVGNNAAWLCSCGEVLLGPTRYPVAPCPKCGKHFEVVPKGHPGSYVDHVREL
jgi:hypothetical protein